jgi:hypothetical protein
MSEGRRVSGERPEIDDRALYPLDELLAQHDAEVPTSEDEREWLEAPSVGREI